MTPTSILATKYQNPFPYKVSRFLIYHLADGKLQSLNGNYLMLWH